MVAILALGAIAGAALTTALTWPLLGWVALLTAPLGGSLVALTIGLVGGRRRGTALSDEATDRMVADLKGVLRSSEGDAVDEETSARRRRA